MVRREAGRNVRTAHQPATPMQKLAIVSAATTLLFTGCETPRQSRTWETVKAVRHAGPFVKEPAATYAGELHKTLQNARIDHKVVTFTFRYRSRILLNREGEETAVIYRDPSTPALPWWLMSERLSSPVWLPTQPVPSQVAFYLRRPATVVKVEDFPAEITKPFRESKYTGKKHTGKKKAGKKHAGKGGKSVVKPASHPAKSKATRRAKK